MDLQNILYEEWEEVFLPQEKALVKLGTTEQVTVKDEAGDNIIDGLEEEHGTV